jgi:hypothetical protein
MQYRIKHWGGGLAQEIAYRQTWESAISLANARLLSKFGTSHKKAVIQTKDSNGEWQNTDWTPFNPQPTTK